MGVLGGAPRMEGVRFHQPYRTNVPIFSAVSDEAKPLKRRHAVAHIYVIALERCNVVTQSGLSYR